MIFVEWKFSLFQLHLKHVRILKQTWSASKQKKELFFTLSRIDDVAPQIKPELVLF